MKTGSELCGTAWHTRTVTGKKRSATLKLTRDSLLILFRINKNQSTESLGSRISRMTPDFYWILHRSLLYSNWLALYHWSQQNLCGFIVPNTVTSKNCHVAPLAPWSRPKMLTHTKSAATGSSPACMCSAEQSIRVISLTHGLRHRFNMLSRPKSWWQGPTSVNGVGHSPKTRPQTLTDGPGIGQNRQLARCVRALHFWHSLSLAAKAFCQ